ncbi:phage regulatory protein/antirepressor Ant [Brevundimonas diminuta]|uniref:phage antirepressor KilAC domain-containing protein n=1 Tax=Brevundimonas diminuta TaxID=293 RepID=UPI002096A8C3|nr:phage regulatory protein/antirepressor Ant [Brevundimonas diminuta]MCO8017491.1 phage regulatory protein/antirepressor Ant [Brevundimonas diminuta]MCO8021011.1 phage regulatory protein/antirepressor Ant [Brevundimonas diminuta]
MNAAPMKEPLMFLPTVTDANGIQTMSSLEIAELTGKRHAHVIRDIRKMLADLNQPKTGSVDFQGSYRDAKGETRECFNLPKRESLILVSGYSVELRAAIIDRWEELERAARRPVMPDLNNPATLRLLLADYANDKIALEEQVAELAPKAEALDRIATADGSMCITDAAKTLQVQPKAAFQFLRAHRWIYSRQGGGEIAYQDKLASGLLEHKTTTIHRSDGSEKVTTQVRVTPKGLARLAKELQPVVRAA